MTKAIYYLLSSLRDKFIIEEKGKEIRELNHIELMKLFEHMQKKQKRKKLNQNPCEMRNKNPNLQYNVLEGGLIKKKVTTRK